MDHIIDGCEQACTKRMLEMPITELSKLIGAKWFLPLEKLSEKSNVPLGTIKGAVAGRKILPRHEKRLRELLEEL